MLQPLMATAGGMWALLTSCYIMAFVYAWIVPSWAHQLLPQLLMEQFDTLPIQYRHIKHMHEGVWLNFFLTKWQLWELRLLFPYMAFVYAWIVPSWADLLLPQLLMEQLDTLLIRCRHIEHMHEGVWFEKKKFCLHRFYWNLLFKTKVCWFEL